MAELPFVDPGGEYYYSLGLANTPAVAGVWDDNGGNNLGVTNSAPAGRRAASDGNVYAFSIGFHSGLAGGKFFASSYGRLVAGYALYIASTGWANNQYALRFQNSGAIQCDVRTDAVGHLFITRNGTQIGSTSSQVLLPGWHYIELDVTFATGATGTADAWVDGLRWVHATSVQTANGVATANQFFFAQLTGSNFVKDIYIDDGSSGPLGDISVQVLYRTGPGVNSAWTASRGTIAVGEQIALSAAANASGGNTVYTRAVVGTEPVNAFVGYNQTVAGFTNAGNNVTSRKCVASTTTTITLVNSGGVTETHAATADFVCVVQAGINHIGTWPNGDTAYILDSTPGDLSDFAGEAFTSVGQIYAVVHASYLRKDDVGTLRQAQQFLLSAGSPELSSTITLGTTYNYFFDPMKSDPHGGGWTASAVSNATCGVKEIA